MKKISGIYKITNTVTGDFYIGSSKDIKSRLAVHKCPSTWKNCPNKQLYKDMNKYSIDKFEFQILAEAEPEQLKEIEQQFIEKLQPTYNQMNAKGLDVGRYKKYHKEYDKSDKCKRYRKEYEKSDKCKRYRKEYQNQLCSYNGEELTLNALRMRFYKAGIEHPAIEAKKYIIMN